MALRDLMVWNKKDNSLLNRDDFFSPMESFRREVDRVFDGFFKDFGHFPSSVFSEKEGEVYSPRINVSEDEENLEVSAELPGIEEKDIQVSLKDQVLTIKGEKKQEEEKKDKSYYRLERSFGSFQRSLRIPEETEVDQIKASFKNGVLKVTLPKSKQSVEKVKRIEVKAS